MKVLHCPKNVGGNPSGLAEAERSLGLDSVLVSVDGRYCRDGDERLCGSGGSRLRAEIGRWELLARALWGGYDIIHLNFGEGVLPSLQWSPSGGSAIARCYGAYASLVGMRDIRLLKRMGKGIFITYQGDDARQGDLCMRLNSDCPCIARYVGEGYYTEASDSAKRRAIAAFDRLADGIFYLNPDLGWALPDRAEFMAYGSVNPKSVPCAGLKRTDGRSPVLLHAPSHRGVKGTEFLLDAVERLKGEGVDFELRLVEGVAYKDALEMYKDADLVVDQLLAGWYGALAVECMALGKPVIAYVRDSDLKFIPPQMRAELPLIGATPDTIFDVLKEWLVVRKMELEGRGLSSRSFVERWHDPARIAERLKSAYESSISKRQ